MKTKFSSPFPLLRAWGIALLLCLAFAALSYGQSATKDTVITIRVSGVYCPQCPPNICARVKKENGVKDCVLVGKPAAVSKFKITYDPGIITYNKVVEAVQATPSCDDPNEKPFKVKARK